MSYETENQLPASTALRDVIEFLELLAYRRVGTWADLGHPEVIAMNHYEERDYLSWDPVILSIHPSEHGLLVHTRTRVGRSAYDYRKQNATVRALKKRFGGKHWTDGMGYDPGPPVPPAASGCHLAMERLDWSLSRLNQYLMNAEMKPQHESMVKMRELWPVMRELDPDVFSSNVLIPYITAMMEDVLKSLYIALLRDSEDKAKVMKAARLSGEQLAGISDRTLSVEEAIAETMPFHLPSRVGEHFRALHRDLDILAPLRRRTKRSKLSLLEKLDSLTARRHALVHRMEIDTQLDKDRVEEMVFDVTDGMSRIYRAITTHFDWPFELPMSSNFKSRRSWERLRKTAQSENGAEQTKRLGDDGDAREATVS